MPQSDRFSKAVGGAPFPPPLCATPVPPTEAPPAATGQKEPPKKAPPVNTEGAKQAADKAAQTATAAPRAAPATGRKPGQAVAAAPAAVAVRQVLRPGLEAADPCHDDGQPLRQKLTATAEAGGWLLAAQAPAPVPASPH